MKIINHFALLLLFGCAVSCTQPENSISNESIGIIPLPSTYELKPGTFYITGQSSIGIDKSDPEMTALANYFNEEISDATGFSLPVNNSGTIIFQLGEHKNWVRRISALDIVRSTDFERIQASRNIQRYTIRTSVTPAGNKVENGTGRRHLEY